MFATQYVLMVYYGNCSFHAVHHAIHFASHAPPPLVQNALLWYSISSPPPLLLECGGRPKPRMCLVFRLQDVGGMCFGNTGWVGVQSPPSPWGRRSFGLWVLMLVAP